MAMYGYAGKKLLVDLNSKKTKIEEIPEAFCRKLLGGNGFSIKFLYDYAKPKIDPLSPDNVLVFAVGPFCGTLIPTSSKYIVQAKSPLTGFQGKAISSGYWSQAFRRAGYDALVIMGRAKKPIYLFIDDNVVEFRDATNLWGKDCWETENIIRETIGDDNVRVAAIGPAGENLVRYACITNDRNRQAGRTGMGAVMGSKQMKAIVVRGSKSIQVAKLDELLELCKELNEKAKDLIYFRDKGTTGIWTHQKGALGIRNYQYNTFEGPELKSGDIRKMDDSRPINRWVDDYEPAVEWLKKHYVHRTLACGICPIACDHVDYINDRPYENTVVGVEYETIYALGPMCGVTYYPGVAKAAELCDRFGLDTISTGVVVAWFMECFEKGIITLEDTEGLELTFGNHEALVEIIKKIAQRKGFGNLLAEGTKAASEKIGKGSEHFAMHSKGLEFPGYDVRGLKTMALAFAVSTRGACHVRSQVYYDEFSGVIDRFNVEKGRGEFVADKENLQTVYDSLMLCKFSRGIYIYSNMHIDKYKDIYTKWAHMYNLATGIPLTGEELRTAGERIYNLEKAYNVREGWTRKDDWLPPRVFKDPILWGPAKGSVVTEEELNFLLDDYYSSRGWTEDGMPAEKKLIELGLNDVAKEVGV